MSSRAHALDKSLTCPPIPGVLYRKVAAQLTDGSATVFKVHNAESGARAPRVIVHLGFLMSPEVRSPR